MAMKLFLNDLSPFFGVGFFKRGHPTFSKNFRVSSTVEHISTVIHDNMSCFWPEKIPWFLAEAMAIFSTQKGLEVYFPKKSRY